MEKWMKGPALGLFFGLTLAVGFAISMQSWDGVVYYTNRDLGRDPAAFNRPLNINDLRAPGSRTAIANALAKEISFNVIAAPLDPKQKILLINVPQPRLRDNSSAQSLACRQFKKMELIFGTDQAVSGEITSMVVTVDCAPTATDPSGRVASSEDKIRVSVPLSEIFSKPTNSTEWLFDEGKVQVGFFNMADQWPTEYYLTSVRYFNPGTDRPTDLKHDHAPETAEGSASFSSESVTGLQVEFPRYEKPIGFSWSK